MLSYANQQRLRTAADAFRRRAPRVVATLNVPERRHRPWLLQHQTRPTRARDLGIVVPDLRASDGDVAIAERLLAAHRAALAVDPPMSTGADVWTLNYEHQRGFAGLLTRGEPRELAAYLCNVWRHDAAHGFCQGQIEYDRLCRDPTYRRFMVLRARDKLVSLAEAVGAAPVENPEAWPPPNVLVTDLAPVVIAINERLGVDIAPPEGDGGLLKLQTGAGLFAERDLYAIYTAYLMRELLGEGGSSVCEIGGGSGRAGYWAIRFGMRPYTIVDLPHVNVVQGFYLAKTLGPDQVAFYGEAAGGHVRVLPNHAIDERSHYDLVLNQDSFPEMHPQVVYDYLDWTARVAHGGLLLSVNHESRAPYGPPKSGMAHVSVPEAVDAVGGFARLQRSPYWLRRGYVTEVYRVGAS